MSPSTATTTPKVAIIGAGPSGLCLARTLYHKSLSNPSGPQFSITVFEAETSRHVRSQGGTLDLHPRSGQAALSEAGLLDEFKRVVRYEGQDMVIADKHGKRHVKVFDVEHGRPEIDRVELRRMLLDSVPEDMIQWGKRVKSVEVGKIAFEDGTTAEGFDLIVGADGAWSKVRPLLTTIPPFYSGVSGFDIKLVDADNRHPNISAMVGRGSFFAFGEEDKQALMFQRNGDGSIRCYAFSTKPESWIKNPGYDVSDDEAIKSALLNDYKEWSDELKDVIRDFSRKGGDEVTPRALYMLPVGLSWPTASGVTVLGDAAHLMTPFAGEGVNQALQDAMELALQILKHPNDLNTAVKDYETDMFPRTQEITQATWQSLLARFAPGGLKGFKGMIMRKANKIAQMMKEQGQEVDLSKKFFFSED
jgi:2-polyprenyl-6-methoxyphenol hydroxylase-like FAD-dependent oxidoreductase